MFHPNRLYTESAREAIGRISPAGRNTPWQFWLLRTGTAASSAPQRFAPSFAIPGAKTASCMGGHWAYFACWAKCAVDFCTV
jgi:hypothetical protein